MKREPARIPVGDATTEKAIDEVRRSVVELARDPFLSGRDFDITLAPNVAKVIPTGLGRKFTNYTLSPARGIGVVYTVVEAAHTDSTVTLKCLTAGGTVTIRMRVW